MKIIHEKINQKQPEENISEKSNSNDNMSDILPNPIVEMKVENDSDETMYEEEKWYETDKTHNEKCPFCQRSFRRTQDVGKHVKYYCLENPNSKCRLNKKPIPPYNCKECKRSFRVKKLLTYHERHECNMKYKCPFCQNYLSGRLSSKHLETCRKKHAAAELTTVEVIKLINVKNENPF